jgi:hypothetical protein
MSARLTLRVALGVLAVTGLTVGVWASVAPHAFFSSFPGLGHTWVVGDGPYNEHLTRDVGDLNLALAVVTVCAAVWLSRPIALATALAWLVYSVPHFAYHAANLQTVAADDRVAELASLAVPIVLGVVILAVLPTGTKPSPASTVGGGGPSPDE